MNFVLFNLRTQCAALSVSYTYLVFSTGREERLPRYRIRGFEEVVTPNIFSCDLWKVSGHYQNYKDDMSYGCVVFCCACPVVIPLFSATRERAWQLRTT